MTTSKRTREALEAGSVQHFGEDEQRGEEPHHPAHLAGAAAQHLEHDVAGDTDEHAVRDGEGERHHQQGEEGGQAVGDVLEADLDDWLDHQEADDDQHGCGGGWRHQADERDGEEREQEEAGDPDGGEAGLAALADARRALDEGGDGGVAGERAPHAGGGVHHHGAAGAREVALLVQDAELSSQAAERAEGVHHVGDEEGEEEEQNGAGGEVAAEERAEVYAADTLAEEGAEVWEGDEAAGAKEAGGVLNAGQQGGARVGLDDSHDPGDGGGGDDAEQQGAAHLARHHQASDEQAGEGDEHDRVVERAELGQAVGVADLDGGAGLDGGEGVELDDVGVGEADEGDEEADAGAGGELDREGDAHDDLLAPGAGDEQQEGEAIQEDEGEGGADGEAARADDGEGEEGVVAEAGGERPGQISPEAHEQRGDDGGEDGADDQRGGVEAGGRHDGRVDEDDVGHRDEGGEAGGELDAVGAAAALRAEGIGEEVGQRRAGGGWLCGRRHGGASSYGKG